MQVEGQHERTSVFLMATGEWVSNTYPTCPLHEDSPPKGELILDVVHLPHDGCTKDLSVTDGDASD